MYLVVSDPHCTEAELRDCQNLIDLIWSLDPKWAAIVFLGDMFHTHAIIHAEVMEFWRVNLTKLGQKWPVIVLEGNHDRPNNRASKASALNALKNIPNVTIVTDVWSDGYATFVPYCHDPVEFLEKANKNANLPVFCHQTFDGAQYENGFYAKDGIDPDRVLASRVISGHIHTKSDIGKVHYVGSPRWRTLSDANQDKSIELINYNGKIVESYDTSRVCRKIIKLEDTQTSPLSITPLPNTKYIIHIKGPADWCESRRTAFPWAKVSVFPTTVNVVLKESEGIQVSLDKYLDTFVPKYGTSKLNIKDIVQDLWAK